MGKSAQAFGLSRFSSRPKISIFSISSIFRGPLCCQATEKPPFFHLAIADFSNLRQNRKSTRLFRASSRPASPVSNGGRGAATAL